MKQSLPLRKCVARLKAVLLSLHAWILSCLGIPVASGREWADTLRRLHEAVGRPFAVFVAHEDYCEGQGGTERYQLQDLEQCNASGINVFQIYPRKLRRKYLFIKCRVRVFGVNFNGESLSRALPVRLLGDVLRVFNQSTGLISYNIHHLLQWSPRVVSSLLREIEGQRVFVFLHDVYFCCPSVHFLRDRGTYCGALEETFLPTDCSDCVHGDKVPQVREQYDTLFRMAEKIISPSSVVSDAFHKHYSGAFAERFVIMEHLQLSFSHLKPPHRNERMRLAYFGLKTPHKGWDTFEKIYKDKTLASLYDFYHVGGDDPPAEAGSVRQINYSFKTDGFNAGIETLLHHRIDIVLLFSSVPESYSYTMHEAYAAGIPILACRNSGNIAYKISNGLIYGRLFESDEGVLAFLRDEASVYRFVKGNTNRFISTATMQSAFLVLTQDARPRLSPRQTPPALWRAL